jgi:hypothetical protein
LAVEIEGGVWVRGRHSRGAGLTADCVKYNEAAILGWTVIRCTSAQVDSGEALDWISRIIDQRMGDRLASKNT